MLLIFYSSTRDVGFYEGASELLVFGEVVLSCQNISGHSFSGRNSFFHVNFCNLPFFLQIILTVSFILGVYYLTSQPLEAVRFGMVLGIGTLTALVSQSFGLLIGAGFDIEVGDF